MGDLEVLNLNIAFAGQIHSREEIIAACDDRTRTVFSLNDRPGRGLAGRRVHDVVIKDENTVYQVRFAKTALPGPVPPLLQRFSMGYQVDLSLLNSIAIEPDTLSSRIYSLVRNVPYGSTATYGPTWLAWRWHRPG